MVAGTFFPTQNLRRDVYLRPRCVFEGSVAYLRPALRYKAAHIFFSAQTWNAIYTWNLDGCRYLLPHPKPEARFAMFLSHVFFYRWRCCWLFFLYKKFPFPFFNIQSFCIVRKLWAPIVVYKSNDYFVNFKLSILCLRGVNYLESVWFQVRVKT